MEIKTHKVMLDLEGYEGSAEVEKEVIEVRYAIPYSLKFLLLEILEEDDEEGEITDDEFSNFLDSNLDNIREKVKECWEDWEVSEEEKEVKEKEEKKED